MIYVFIVFLIFLVMGVPVAFAIGASGILPVKHPFSADTHCAAAFNPGPEHFHACHPPVHPGRQPYE